MFAASSGEQALLIASEQEHIDLLITDVVMPKMSGRELSQMLGSLRPALKTIHMSGYTDDAVLRHGFTTRVQLSCRSRSAWVPLQPKCATRLTGQTQHCVHRFQLSQFFGARVAVLAGVSGLIPQ